MSNYVLLAALLPPGLPWVTLAVISPALFGITFMGERLLIQKAQPILLFKPEHLSKVNFTARVTLISPGLTMGHFPQVTAQLLKSCSNRTVLSCRRPGHTFCSPAPLDCHQNSSFALGLTGFVRQSHSRLYPIFSQSCSQNCQPRLRENHTCKHISTQHFHCRQSLQ